jgi:2-polyprenyl-3-methyl-5-hydroxy-6-metoxy-1,4-benzoquinol methylase
MNAGAMLKAGQSGADFSAVRACPACAARSGRHLSAYDRDHWRIVDCGVCDFVYLENPPGYDALVDDFAWEKTYDAEAEYRRRTRPVTTWLSRALRFRFALFGRSVDRVARLMGGGRVLDIGCGAGNPAFMRGCIPYGIEISRALFKLADASMRAHGGRAVHAPAVEGLQAFEDDMFDGVIMHSYLEHEERPLEVLSGVARVLKRAGKAYVRVPNFGSINRRVTGAKWCGFRYPDHVNYFTVDSLAAMAARAGLTLKLVNRLTVSVDDNIKAVLTKS